GGIPNVSLGKQIAQDQNCLGLGWIGDVSRLRGFAKLVLAKLSGLNSLPAFVDRHFLNELGEPNELDHLVQILVRASRQNFLGIRLAFGHGPHRSGNELVAIAHLLLEGRTNQLGLAIAALFLARDEWRIWFA